MTGAYVNIRAIWDDADLIEIEASVALDRCSGTERAYVRRDELFIFAAELDTVPAEGTSAKLVGGQRDLGYAELEVLEYGMARSLYVDVIVRGRANCARD